METLETEKLNLRKQLIDRALSRKTTHHGAQDTVPNDRGGSDIVGGDLVAMGDEDEARRTVMELRRQVRGLEERCRSERREAELELREKTALKEKLEVTQEQVTMYKIHVCTIKSS